MAKNGIKTPSPDVFREAHDELQRAGMKRTAKFSAVQLAVRVAIALADNYEALPATTKRAVDQALGSTGVDGGRKALRNLARTLGRSPAFPRARAEVRPLCMKMAEHLPPTSLDFPE